MRLSYAACVRYDRDGSWRHRTMGRTVLAKPEAPRSKDFLLSQGSVRSRLNSGRVANRPEACFGGSSSPTSSGPRGRAARSYEPSGTLARGVRCDPGQSWSPRLGSVVALGDRPRPHGTSRSGWCPCGCTRRPRPDDAELGGGDGRPRVGGRLPMPPVAGAHPVTLAGLEPTGRPQAEGLQSRRRRAASLSRVASVRRPTTASQARHR